MRTTVNLDDHLLGQAKELAARNHRTLTSVLEDALREVLGRASGAPPRERVTLPASDRAPGIRPGVDLDNSAALLELMERDDASA
jgi:hypothetical protein